MADEVKKDETVSEKVDEVVDRVSKLKKAGIPTILALLITAASIPGVTALFDKSGTEAKINAAVSYQLLKTQTEAVAQQVKENREEIKALRDMITAMLMQRSGRVSMTDLRLPPPAPVQPIPTLPPTIDAAQNTAVGQAAMASAGIGSDGEQL